MDEDFVEWMQMMMSCLVFRDTGVNDIIIPIVIKNVQINIPFPFYICNRELLG